MPRVTAYKSDSPISNIRFFLLHNPPNLTLFLLIAPGLQRVQLCGCISLLELQSPRLWVEDVTPLPLTSVSDIELCLWTHFGNDEGPCVSKCIMIKAACGSVGLGLDPRGNSATWQPCNLFQITPSCLPILFPQSLQLSNGLALSPTQRCCEAGGG